MTDDDNNNKRSTALFEALAQEDVSIIDITPEELEAYRKKKKH